MQGTGGSIPGQGSRSHLLQLRNKISRTPTREIKDPACQSKDLMQPNEGKSLSWCYRDFPHGPVVKNLPFRERDRGLIPGWGTKIAHDSGQLSLCSRAPCSTTKSASATTKAQHSQKESLLLLYILWVWRKVWRLMSIITASYRVVSLPWKSSVNLLFIPYSTNDLLQLSTVLPFPECHAVDTIQCRLFRLPSFI